MRSTDFFHMCCVLCSPQMKFGMATFSYTHTYTHTCTQLLSGFSCWCLNGKTPLTCARPPTGAPRVCVGSSSSVGECSALSCCSTGHFSHIFIFCVCMPRRLRLRAWKLNECLQANSGRFLVQNASVTRMERIFFFFFNATVTAWFPSCLRTSVGYYMELLWWKGHSQFVLLHLSLKSNIPHIGSNLQLNSQPATFCS